MNLFEVLQKIDEIEAKTNKTESDFDEYSRLQDLVGRMRDKYNETNNFIVSVETDSVKLRSEINKEEVRRCRFCGKEDFLFSGVDETSMLKYGCCRECFCLFLE